MKKIENRIRNYIDSDNDSFLSRIGSDSPKEGLKLAEQWKNNSKFYEAIHIANIDLCEIPFKSSVHLEYFSWRGMPFDWNINIYDGGAFSDDKKLVVKYPKRVHITRDNKMKEEVLEAWKMWVNTKSKWKFSKQMASPLMVFRLCALGYWKTPDFKILLDLTNVI